MELSGRGGMTTQIDGVMSGVVRPGRFEQEEQA